MIIAFCGMDGTGKTTLSRALKEELVKQGHSAIVIEPFRYILFDPILKPLRGTEGESKLGQKKNRLFLLKLWPLFALLDHWVQFLVKIRPLTKKYDYVIADRFFFDFAASFNYYGYTTPWLEKLYLRLLPKADLAFVIDLPTEHAQRREQKNRHDYDFFVQQREFYQKLAQKLKLPVVKTTSGTKKALNEVLQKL